MLNNVKSNNHVVRLTLGVPDKRENIASQHFADIEFYSLRDLVGRGINTEDVAVSSFPQEIDDCAGTTTQIQNSDVSVRGHMCLDEAA